MDYHPILALTGRKRAGKDTFARFLVDNHDYHAVAFADTLRDILLRQDPFIPHPLYTAGAATHMHLTSAVQVWGWEGLKTIAEPLYRGLLRNTGEAIGRHDPLYFARVTHARVMDLNRTGPVVITDMRFPAEVGVAMSFDARVVRIVNPRNTNDDSHVTETALDDLVPWVEVCNDLDLTHLEQQAAFVANLAASA